MSILTMPVLPPSGPPPRKRWSVDEFHLLCGLPKFENRRMILIDGEILDMPNPNPPHNYTVTETSDALHLVFDKSYCIRVQMPLVLSQVTDPIPDLAVVEGPRKKYATVNPTWALLVVEVSDSSLSYDLGDKANLYAAGGIADYWVIELNNRQIIVFRDPVADVTVAFGHRYNSRQTFDASATVSPLAAPNSSIRVGDLLP